VKLPLMLLWTLLRCMSNEQLRPRLWLSWTIRRVAMLWRGSTFFCYLDIFVSQNSIKPETVLMVRGSQSIIKLNDFGSGCFVGHHKYEYIQSRFYRAPEIRLGFHMDHQWTSGAQRLWSQNCWSESHSGREKMILNSFGWLQLCAGAQHCNSWLEEFDWEADRTGFYQSRWSFEYRRSKSHRSFEEVFDLGSIRENYGGISVPASMDPFKGAFHIGIAQNKLVPPGIGRREPFLI
jgi:hypothetical protein